MNIVGFDVLPSSNNGAAHNNGDGESGDAPEADAMADDEQSEEDGTEEVTCVVIYAHQEDAAG